MSARTAPFAYDSFAWFYDRYWGSGPMAFTARVLPILDSQVLSQLPSGARILDLCCGSGQLAAELSSRGFQVTGVDGSAELLAYARRHAPSAEFIHADARAFALPKRYDAAFSFYDSLNHIMELNELAIVFRNVRVTLRDGAPFLFDLNMEEGFRSRWRGSFGLAEPDHVMINLSSYDPESKVGQTTVTMFRKFDGVWRRSDVTLYQRCYAENEVRAVLIREGFSGVRTFDAERDLGMERQVGRTFFLARTGQ